MKHKPNCSINISCAVYHADGICNHPKYGKCDCGLETLNHNKQISEIVEEFNSKFVDGHIGKPPDVDDVRDWLTKTLTTQQTAHEAEVKDIIKKKIEDTKKYWNEKAPDNCSLCWEDGYCRHATQREALEDLLETLSNKDVT